MEPSPSFRSGLAEVSSGLALLVVYAVAMGVAVALYWRAGGAIF
jgi:hypothetical protein